MLDEDEALTWASQASASEGGCLCTRPHRESYVHGSPKNAWTHGPETSPTFTPNRCGYGLAECNISPSNAAILKALYDTIPHTSPHMTPKTPT